jgi:hypothetical protein
MTDETMVVIKTKGGVELRVPRRDLESITEVAPSGDEHPVPAHPYLHREGVNRCAACWQDRLHPAHTDTGVR